MAIGVEWQGESYGLLIDEIGEVLKLPAASREDDPVNLDARLAARVGRVCTGLKIGCWWFWTSIAFSTRAVTAMARERHATTECLK